MADEDLPPSYVKKCRAFLKKVQASSSKQQAIDETVPHNDIEDAQASSSKQQAIDETVPHNDIEEAQASSSKHHEKATIK